MLFLKFKNSSCNDIFSLTKITSIKNVGIPYTLGKCEHYINFDDGKSIEINDDEYKKLIGFLCGNSFLAEIV